jgi:dTDP-4-amino-4,6-dideoxygalactose transaminase
MNDPYDLGAPAIHGGKPTFPAGVPLARPRVPDPAAVADDIRRILESGALTNGETVRRFERASAEYLGVRHCIAVSSCTVGLLLLLKAADLTGDVILPSFTFAATAHAVHWNGLRPVFADVDPGTLTLSPGAVSRATGIRTSAILATHVYGTPCDVEGLAKVADDTGIRLFFDAAHAFGSRRGTRMIGGFGDAEVFSFSPTKVVVAAEGGLIATNDDLLAERCRIGRDYGHPGDYDCRFPGLNGRMSELHAAVALASMSDLESRLQEREALAGAYRAALEDVAGISFPGLTAGDRSTYKDLTILVDPDRFGADADALGAALAAEGVETKRYYSPPVHRMTAYRSAASRNEALPVTDQVSARALTLPLWSGMGDEHVFGIVGAIRRVHRFSGGGKNYEA